MAKRFISYQIGNGNFISLWFDPWWHGQALAGSPRDIIIANTGSSPRASVHSLISTGHWVLPSQNHRHHHVNQTLNNWLTTFDFPDFSLEKWDIILWDGTPGNKVTARIIWNSIRRTSLIIPWTAGVWSRLRVPRYAFFSWLLCHDRVNTLARLARFGITNDVNCCLCVGGLENAHHLFISCPYSSFILETFLTQTLGLSVDLTHTWAQLVTSSLDLPDYVQRQLVLLFIQIFAYHIWRERNARIHGKGIFSPRKLLDGIMVDLHARVHTSTWFLKFVGKRPMLRCWITC